MKLKLILAASLTLTATVPMVAHHSFAAEFDSNKPMRLEGVLSKIEWTNPHSYFYLDIKDDKGNVATWACEGAGPYALSRRGFRKGDIKIGDKMTVDGYAAKDGSRMIDARRVYLADGRLIYGGSEGDGGPGQQ